MCVLRMEKANNQFLEFLFIQGTDFFLLCLREAHGEESCRRRDTRNDVFL